MKTATRLIPVDYSVIGIPRTGLRVSIRTLRSDREGLSPGDVVVLTGDAVEDQMARVLSISDHDPAVQIEFLGSR